MKKKRILSILCVVLLLASGCGSTAKTTKEKDKNEGQDSAAGAMGRYMETSCELPSEINRNGGLNRLSDGALTIISFGSGLYRSVDGGTTWVQEDTIWFPMLQNVYCLDAVMGPDGTVAATCLGGMPPAAQAVYEKPVEEGWEGNYCVFGMPDGSVKIVDFGFTQEDGNAIESFWFKEDGRLFAGDMSGRLYEVNIANASLRELFVADRAVGYVDFSDSVLLAVGHDRLYQYDLSKQVLLAQDDTVDGFIRQELSGGTVSYTSGGYPLTVTGSEDGETIYIACRDGLYRHARGGSVMEQIIDGALGTFGDASSTIYNVEILENQEFLVLFNPSVGLVHYTWDETVPSMPDKEIRIYSLEENRSVRQAVTAYKKEHTDMYVRYEVGMEGDSGMTREDALKKLNTQILAGEGPDVLILDGLPLDTYIEKGLLKDLSGVLGALEGEDALFPNLVDSMMQEDGAVYAMPLCIRVPLLTGEQDVIAKIKDLESFAGEMENLRRMYPTGGLLGIYDSETLLRLFGMVCCPSWLDEKGEMDPAAVTDFLVQTKRIYDAEMQGAVQEEISVLNKEDTEMAQYGIDARALKMEVCQNVLNISRGYARLACGYVEDIQLCLDSVTSVIREDEKLCYTSFCGQGEKVYIPQAMTGISAGTAQPEEAEDFVKTIFSREAQERMYEGYPINRAAFEAVFDFASPNSDNGSMVMEQADGTQKELSLYWPDETEEKAFTELVESLEAPVLADEWLCELVYENGTKVLEGNISPENGAEEIVKKAAIYLAE